MLETDLLDILKKVRSGELSAAEGAARMDALDQGIEVIPAAPAEPPPTDFDLGWWKYAWLVPVGIGTGIFIFSALLTSWAYVNARMFWFYCSWLPLMLGLLVLLIGLWSIRARWVHVRIRENEGTRVSFSIPLPLGLPSWFLRTFSPNIPALKEKHMQDLPAILDALRHTNDPVTVEVNEKDGDTVRVYII